jgi:hypothetical protein
MGTVSPAKTLDVYSTATTNTAQIVVSDAGSTNRLYLGTFSNGSYISCGGTYQSGWSANGSNAIANIGMSATTGASTIQFETSTTNGVGPSERMRITSGGSLLIGSTTQGYNPQTQGYLLGVKSNTTQAFISIAKSGQTLDSGGIIIGLDTTTGYVYVRENIGLTFGTNNTERFSISSAGAATFSSSVTANSHIYATNGSISFGGTSSAPSTDPAIYRVSGNDLAIAIGSSERFRIASTGNVTIQGSLQVNTNGFSLKGWRQYAVQISAGGSTNTGAIIFRQFQDSVNWNTGGVVVEIINYSYAHNEFDTRKDFARYGYSGNAATVNQINGNITGKIPQPYWGSAVQGSGVYYYRDLMIDIQPYHAYVISLTTPMSLNGSSTVGNGTIYLFS